jgi:RNA polymerase sigma-70 factor (ECF subfamily)
MACDESGSEYCQDEVFSRDVFFKAYDDMNANFAQFVGRAVVRDDLDLVHATQGGDVCAFEELVERYDRKLLRIAEHITHNHEDSQDAVQEAFLKAFQHVGDFLEHSQFSTWLIRITVNQALMKLRKRRTTKEVPLDEDFQADGDMPPREVADWAPNPEELYRTSELRDILIKALEVLRPALRTVFVLRDIEGLTIDQTAEVLDLSPAAVKARLWRARLQLRELLSEYFSKHKEPTRARSEAAPPRKVGFLGKLSLGMNEAHGVKQSC